MAGEEALKESRASGGTLEQFGGLKIMDDPEELLFMCITFIHICHIRNSNRTF